MLLAALRFSPRRLVMRYNGVFLSPLGIFGS